MDLKSPIMQSITSNFSLCQEGLGEIQNPRSDWTIAGSLRKKKLGSSLVAVCMLSLWEIHSTQIWHVFDLRFRDASFLDMLPLKGDTMIDLFPRSHYDICFKIVTSLDAFRVTPVYPMMSRAHLTGDKRELFLGCWQKIAITTEKPPEQGLLCHREPMKIPWKS